MPIYVISTKDSEDKRLVKAVSSPAAIAHCAREQFSAQLINKVEDAAPLFSAGVKLETAGEPLAEPEGKPQGEDGSRSVRVEDIDDKTIQAIKDAKPGEGSIAAGEKIAK